MGDYVQLNIESLNNILYRYLCTHLLHWKLSSNSEFMLDLKRLWAIIGTLTQNQSSSSSVDVFSIM